MNQKELLTKSLSEFTQLEGEALQQYASQLDQELKMVRAERDELESDLKEVAGVLIEAATAVNIQKITTAKNPQVALMKEIGSIITPSPFERNKKGLMERFAFFGKLGPIYMKHKHKFENLKITE